jgi:hypothetical protein
VWLPRHRARDRHSDRQALLTPIYSFPYAWVNQVPDVEHVVVASGTGVPTSGLILGIDR